MLPSNIHRDLVVERERQKPLMLLDRSIVIVRRTFKIFVEGE
jgi:hypothetical protein